MIRCRLRFEGLTWVKDVALLALPGLLDYIIDDDDDVVSELRRLRVLQVEHHIGHVFVGVLVDNGDSWGEPIPKRIDVTPEMFAASGWR